MSRGANPLPPPRLTSGRITASWKPSNAAPVPSMGNVTNPLPSPPLPTQLTERDLPRQEDPPKRKLHTPVISVPFVSAPTGLPLLDEPATDATTPVTPDEPLVVTNNEKLSLPANTPVGTEVMVTDGFVINGLTNWADGAPMAGFFGASGTENGKPKYPHAIHQFNPDDNSDGNVRVYYNSGEGAWSYWTGGMDVLATPGNEDYPWQSDLSTVLGLVLTYPATQRLITAPSARGGYFIVTPDGGLLYTIRPINTGSNEGSKEYANVIGHQNEADGASVSWDFGSGTGEFDATNRWVIYSNVDDGAALYYATGDVATPDLAINWKKVSDDSPASITVASVTAGQIAAGMKFGSDFYTVTTPVNGRNAYHDVLGVAPDFTFNGTIWTDGTHNGTGAPAFPWDVTGITITRDDVAAEQNWEIATQ